jgi:glyoxylase-like metal-dependent hydrolase (beta-lactamase superfamily II)
MNEVKVLIPGFAEEHDGFEKVSPSVVLIKTNETKIIVDPGFNRQAILDALDKENLITGQINFVLLTHTHLDHCALVGMFENAAILDNSDQFLQDGTIKRQDKDSLGDDIQILQTPGHDQFHCSVAIKTEDKGMVVIAGDIFWWLDGNEPNKDRASLLNLEDPYVKDQIALTESRKKILDIADYIIPGHGNIFKNYERLNK